VGLVPVPTCRLLHTASIIIENEIPDVKKTLWDKTLQSIQWVIRKYLTSLSNPRLFNWLPPRAMFQFQAQIVRERTEEKSGREWERFALEVPDRC
jgi:hypothetical protein